jgi:hypothetical protein
VKLDDIIEGASSNEDLASLLRKCLVLAYTLNNETLKTWVERELNGYNREDELPHYRRGTGIARGLFLGPFGGQIPNQPLAPSVMEEIHRHWATDIRLTQPIVGYHVPKDASSGMLPWPADLVVYYQEKFVEDWALNRAWMEVPAGMIAGLLDSVRTKVLTFALELKAVLPEETEEAVQNIAPSIVDRVVNVTIMGGNNVIGDVRQFSAPTVIAGDVASLNAALNAAGVLDVDIQKLDAILRSDGSREVSVKTPRQPSPKALTWIRETAKKVTGGAAKAGGSLVEEVIRQAVLKYLGF